MESHRDVTFVFQFCNLQKKMVEIVQNPTKVFKKFIKLTMMLKKQRYVIIIFRRSTESRSPEKEITGECLLDTCCMSKIMRQDWKEKFFENFSNKELDDLKLSSVTTKRPFFHPFFLAESAALS